MTTTSQFYTGLVARLYEPLAGHLPVPEVYQRFVEKYGEPALELACCYLAGPSFCLIDSLDDAQETLRRVYTALTPGGHFLLSVFKPAEAALPSPVKSTILDDGSVATVQSIAEERNPDLQRVSTHLRYMCAINGETETLDRTWVLQWYAAAALTDMLSAAGFSILRIAGDDGNTVAPTDTNFFVIAEK
ncbi:MAG: hypothetical protein V2I41_05245 [Pseudomonadales bacterium]|jgi:hypothetical protein|nr:hypothetical protein [Pseudomonadales bacterium]